MKRRKSLQHKNTRPDKADAIAELTPQKQWRAFPLIVALMAAGLLLYFISISRDYPYYFVWDMDLVSCLDTALIHSGELPDHINHPGFGMYLLLHFSTALGHAANAVSVLDLPTIYSCPNPMAAVSELTIFLRMHSPFLAVAITLLLWAACCRLFTLSRGQQLLLLLVLGTQESLVYHASMVRTEFYAVFYWSVAVLLTVLAATAKSRWPKLALMLAAGLAAGLCLQTKLQGLFYVTMLPILLLLLPSLSGPSEPAAKPSSPGKARYGGLIISGANLLVYLLLGAAAWGQNVPVVLPWPSEYVKITPASALVFAALAVLVLGQAFVLVRRQGNSRLAITLGWLNLLAGGFMLSFACHFFLYSDLNLSLRYLLYDFKELFFRKNYYETKLFGAYFQIFAKAFAFRPVAFSVMIGLALLAATTGLARMIRLSRRQIVLLLLITIVVLANVATGTRGRVRDLLWREMLMNFTSVLLCCIIITRALRFRIGLRILSVGALVLLLVVNCVNSRDMRSRIDANFNHYGFKQNRWFSATFRQGSQLQYAALMRDKYQLTGDQRWPMMQKGMSGAAHPERIRRMVEFVFKNQTITLRNIGMAFEGFAVWADQPNCRIFKLPAFLRGATVVDNSSIPLRPGHLFMPNTVREQIERLDKFRQRRIAEVLAVLTRRDLDVMLFVEPGDIPRITDEYIRAPETPCRITLRQDTGLIQMHGLRVTNYSEIPLANMRGRFFFTIRQL